MSDKTESFLTSVEKRLEAATPGKWEYSDEDYPGEGIKVKGQDEYKLVLFGQPVGCENTSVCFGREEDADLIVNSKSDLEKAVKALRVALREMEKHHGCCNTCYSCPSCDMVNSLKEIESVLGEK